MRNIGHQLRVTARELFRRPGYTLIIVATLALGIGANVAMFTVLNAVVLRPLPYPDADRIVKIRHHAPGLNLSDLESSPALIEHYRETARSFAFMAGFDLRERNLTGTRQPERIRVVGVTPELFDVLAVRPARGRAFTRADVQTDSPLVVILTHAMWASHFGSDTGVVGRRIELDGRQAEIVGIMPPGFAFPDTEPRLLTPLRLDRDSEFGAFGTRAIARLAPGVTLERAGQELALLQAGIPSRFPDVTREQLSQFGWSVSAETLHEDVVRTVSRPLWLLFVSAGLVLVIAGVNVVNLLLARAESRRRELTTRRALGARRGHIAATFLYEGVVLAVAGGAAGSLIAAGGIQVLVARAPAVLPRLHEVSVDGAVLAFAFALSVVAGLVLGAVPAGFSELALRSVPLHDESRWSTPGRIGQRVRGLLIVGQVAVALVLLVSSGLIMHSVRRLYAVDPGFAAEGLLTAGVSLGTEPNRARAITFYQQVKDEVAGLPGVVSVGATTSVPIAARGFRGANFAVESRPPAENAIPPVAMYQAIADGYFETLGIPLRTGRTVTRADVEQRRAITWVNETFARRYLADRPIGERVLLGDEPPSLEVVGVVGDVRTMGLREAVRPTIYLPLGTPVGGFPLDVVHIVVRTSGPPALLAPSLRAAVGRVNATVPLTQIQTMDEVIAASLAQISFTMTLLMVASGMALVLGVIGLYGVTSYVVTQRIPEIGVRLALGAQPSDVRTMVLRQGLTVAVVGIVVGLAAASALAGVMSSLVFDISARDPGTYGLVAAIVAVVCAAATYLPARRAARTDPSRALRADG